MQNAAPALLPLRWDSVRKPGEGLGFQIPFIGAARADGLDVPPNVRSSSSMGITDGPQGHLVLLDAEEKIQIRVILEMGDRVVGFVPSVKDYNGGFTVFPPVNQSAQSALFIVRDSAADFVLPHVAIHKSMV